MSGIDRALYESAHDFPGGMEALANLLGRAVGTAYNKADPGCETHQFTVKETVAMMIASRDFRPAQAICRVIDHAAIPYGDYRRVSDAALLDCHLKVTREMGESAGFIQQALAKGAISPTDWAQIDRELAEDIEAILELRSRLEGLRRG